MKSSTNTDLIAYMENEMGYRSCPPAFCRECMYSFDAPHLLCQLNKACVFKVNENAWCDYGSKR